MSKQPDNAANSLLSSLGGWLTANRDMDKQALFPLASYVKTTTSDSLSSELITTVLDNSTFLPKLSNSPVRKDIITAIPVYFRQYNVSLITFTTLGNDYISLKTQYYHADNSPITKEVEIGRFLDLKMHSVAVFNESAMALAYSIRKPGTAVSSASYGYTILLQYITPQATRIVNIAQNTNGIFGIDIVPTIDSSTKLLVSYAGNDNVLYTQKCEITSSMMSHVVITNQPISMPQSGIITVYVNAFQAQTLGQSNQATFNVIWSYLDQRGIYIQRYNLNDGSPVATTTNIPSEPDSLRVGADEIDKTIVAWQSNNNPQQASTVSLQLLSQDPVKTQEYKQLNFQSGNYSIIDASVLPATNKLVQQSPVAIDLINNNNQTKTLILDASSYQMVNISIVTENNDLTTLSPNSKPATVSDPIALANIVTTNANSYPFADILGKISKININAPQCLAQTTATSQIPEVQRVFEQYQNMLKEQPELISQVQSLLSNTKLTEALGKLGIKKETLYSIMNNANSIEDVISSFEKFNPFKDLDLSQIPDTDISAQMAQARTFNQTMSNAIFGDGTGTDSSAASVSNLLIQLLDLINNNASEEQFVEFFATTTKDVFVALIRTLLTPIFDELPQQTTGRGFQEQECTKNIIVNLVIMFVIIAASMAVGGAIGGVLTYYMKYRGKGLFYGGLLIGFVIPFFYFATESFYVQFVDLCNTPSPSPASTPNPVPPVLPTPAPTSIAAPVPIQTHFKDLVDINIQPTTKVLISFQQKNKGLLILTQDQQTVEVVYIDQNNKKDVQNLSSSIDFFIDDNVSINLFYGMVFIFHPSPLKCVINFDKITTSGCGSYSFNDPVGIHQFCGKLPGADNTGPDFSSLVYSMETTSVIVNSYWYSSADSVLYTNAFSVFFHELSSAHCRPCIQEVKGNQFYQDPLNGISSMYKATFLLNNCLIIDKDSNTNRAKYNNTILPFQIPQIKGHIKYDSNEFFVWQENQIFQIISINNPKITLIFLRTQSPGENLVYAVSLFDSYIQIISYNSNNIYSYVFKIYKKEQSYKLETISTNTKNIPFSIKDIEVAWNPSLTQQYTVTPQKHFRTTMAAAIRNDINNGLYTLQFSTDISCQTLTLSNNAVLPICEYVETSVIKLSESMEEIFKVLNSIEISNNQINNQSLAISKCFYKNIEDVNANAQLYPKLISLISTIKNANFAVIFLDQNSIYCNKSTNPKSGFISTDLFNSATSYNNLYFCNLEDPIITIDKIAPAFTNVIQLLSESLLIRESEDIDFQRCLQDAKTSTFNSTISDPSCYNCFLTEISLNLRGETINANTNSIET